MVKPRILALTGYGINCDDDTKFAFEKAGAEAEIVHVNDLIDKRKNLNDYQILALCGGFSYGDDTGSGNAMAWRIKNHLWDEVIKFVNEDKLAIGICNGFQILTNLGLVPAMDHKYGNREVALIYNNTARYNCRWVDLKLSGNSPWTKDIENISLPIAHGEGKFFANEHTLQELNSRYLIAARYVNGAMCEYQNLPYNPNGSLEDIAAITDETGRIMGMMPHPERAISFTQLPNWPLIKEQFRRKGLAYPEESDGIKILKNGVRYFS